MARLSLPMAHKSLKRLSKLPSRKINGTVEGDIHATKELVLGRSASVTGRVMSPALTIEEGAQLNAKCVRVRHNIDQPA